jgi:AbrB family looped-hinge helix DNA binding protein
MKSMARVSEKGQVTIPKRIRERMGIGAGDVLEFHEEDGKLVASKSLTRGRFHHLFGILHLEGSVDDAITDMRGPAELP